MNKAKLKTYAPQARREFIQAMTDRAAFYGLTATKNEPMVERGDVAVIGGRSFPIAVARKRKALEGRINRHGFEQTMEAMAYTWFNRLVAIRYMELHGYLEHGYRVLSVASGQSSVATDKSQLTTDNEQLTTDNEQLTTDNQQPTTDNQQLTPDIVRFAEHVDLPGLKRETVIDLKLAGNRESELYRLLLTAQCNALHTAMPFLFEKIDDETELLLPDNLLNSDSLIRKLVGEIEEEDWNEVEIIGWLYQFYISEKKDEVIGKVVASEDIPAATQLFTPNWIVKYLVQNTLGRQWMEHHPESPLKAKMEYYIEPAEQTEEVQEQLKEIVRQRAWRNRNLTTDGTDVTDLGNTDAAGLSVPSVVDLSLNPENLTLLDPACGSGHILVEAYDLFKAIYLERGYRARDIPALILQKNLFGMEIDDRAAQLAAFALMMKARADDRRIFDSEAKPNIVAFEDSQGMKASEIHFALTSPLKGEKVGELESPAPDGHLIEPDDNLFTRAEAAKAAASRTPTTVNFSQGDIAALLELFENAKTFGSLIQVPPKLAVKLPEIENRLEGVLTHGDLTHASAHVLKPHLQQARLLARQYDAVVANPPYMGGKGMYVPIKDFAKRFFPRTKADLFAVFMERSFGLLHDDGRLGMVAMQSWMFLPSFEEFRTWLLSMKALVCLAHLGPRAFSSLSGEVVQTAASVFGNRRIKEYRPTFQRLIDGGEEEKALAIRSKANLQTTLTQEAFEVIPNVPIAYWIGEGERRAFADGIPLKTIGMPRQGNTTTNNARFVRSWYEVSVAKIGFGYTSMDAFNSDHKKWIPYNKGGGTLRWYGLNESVVNWENSGFEIKAISHSVVANEKLYLRDGITWATVSSSKYGFRRFGAGFIFDNKGACLFLPESLIEYVLAILNSDVCRSLLIDITPSVSLQPGDVGRLPIIEPQDSVVRSELIENVKRCIESARTLWDSQEVSWDFKASPVLRDRTQRDVATAFDSARTILGEALHSIRELEWRNTELLRQVYGLHHASKDKDEFAESSVPTFFDTATDLLSYAVGCIMGRYSLDKPGLIYADSGNQGFDASQYKTFRADDDGIIPLLETDWGIRDDATNRFVEFIDVCWPGDSTTDDIEGTTEQTATASVKSVVKTSPHLEENLKFVADSLGPTGSEQPRDTIRRYLSTGFYKHHLSMYKKRPIYWLFSSGKQRAFQCLVYLHRYHEGTLARMRTEYVIPLQGQIAARIEQLEGDKAKATSTSHRKKLQKEQDDLKKQQTELLTFEEKLKHAADQKISLDLDDGVKVNYAKFGDLLAEVKAVCGTKDDD